MGTFENGWICRNCWSANREQDGRCYRCHADRPDYAPGAFEQLTRPVLATNEVTHNDGAPRQIPARVAFAGPPKPAPDKAAVGAAACASCSKPLLLNARFCTQCGASVNARQPAPAARPSPVPMPVQQPAAAAVGPTPAVLFHPVGASTVPSAAAAVLAAPRFRVPTLSLSAVRQRAGHWVGSIVDRALRRPAVAAVERWTGQVADAVTSLRSRRPRRESVLFVAWLGLSLASTVMLVAFAGAGGEASRSLFEGMLVILALSLLSALTAALTIALLGPRRRAVEDLTREVHLLREQMTGKGEASAARPAVAAGPAAGTTAPSPISGHRIARRAS